MSIQSCRQAVSSRAAGIVEQAVHHASSEEPALLLLSGGSSVLDVCVELAQRPLPWSAVGVGQLDERAAPAAHPERAWPGIEAAFLAHTPTEVAGRYPIPVDHLDAARAARSYHDTLGHLVKRARNIVGVCGLGEDGHVASLLAGDEKTVSPSRVLTTGPYSGLRRVTISMAFLRTLPTIIVVASGHSKALTMQRLLSAGHDMPAASLPSHTKFVIDQHAASLMDQSPFQE